MMEQNTKFYTVGEVAKMLRVSPSSIYRAIGRGQLRGVKIGRRLRIPASALEELEKSRCNFS